MRIWLALAVTVLAAGLIVELADRPPRPLGPDAPPSVFSEARARVVTDHLAETIGPRVIGTPGRDAAAAYLIGELRRIPGVEVEVQEVRAAAASPTCWLGCPAIRRARCSSQRTTTHRRRAWARATTRRP